MFPRPIFVTSGVSSMHASSQPLLPISVIIGVQSPLALVSKKPSCKEKEMLSEVLI